MKSICGGECEECELYKNKKCEGCKKTNGCPFGKKCWIAKYIEVGGKKSFNQLKEKLIIEINNLNIEGMPKIEELYPLYGSFVNLEYFLPNKDKVKFLEDDETYLGNQVECLFNDGNDKKYFGIIANLNFILVSEYEEYGSNSELIIYKKR